MNIEQLGGAVVVTTVVDTEPVVRTEVLVDDPTTTRSDAVVASSVVELEHPTKRKIPTTATMRYMANSAARGLENREKLVGDRHPIVG